jgi:hypothetical protein
MANLTYRVSVQLKDVFKKVNINDASPTVFVCTAGTPSPATITDLDGNALTNPFAPSRSGVSTNGLIEFLYSASNTAEETGLDIYGITAGGNWFEYTSVTPGPGPIGGPGGPNEINIDTSIKRLRMKIPFGIAWGAVAATEFSCGIKVPASALILDRLHGAGLLMTTIQTGKTINVGILSTDTGGAASGFINGSSLAPTAPSLLVTGTNGSLFSSNAPYNTDSETGGVANGLDISYTLSSGTTTAAGFLLLPYMKP